MSNGFQNPARKSANG